MLQDLNPLAPCNQTQQIHQERASTDSMLKTIVVGDIQISHPEKPEARDDFTSILQAIEMEYDSSERRDAPRLMAEDEDEEQREPVLTKTHRRTRATDWSELSRTFQDENEILRHEKHRRSVAMTEDDFMEITTCVCDELYGPGVPPRAQHPAVWDSL